VGVLCCVICVLFFWFVVLDHVRYAWAADCVTRAAQSLAGWLAGVVGGL